MTLFCNFRFRLSDVIFLRIEGKYLCVFVYLQHWNGLSHVCDICGTPKGRGGFRNNIGLMVNTILLASVRGFGLAYIAFGGVPVRYRKGPLSQMSRVDWTGYKQSFSFKL